MNQRRVREIGYIIFRNVFLLVNAIIFGVVALLFAFGDTQAGIFLGFILVVNISLGLSQEIHAWLVLERLQLLTALRMPRINADGTETITFAEELKKGDLVKVKLGDQIPCDGLLTQAISLEVNEALITGESVSFSRGAGEKLLAGGIITSGSGVMTIETIFSESRTAQMTKTIKKYALNVSPIQQSVNTIIKYSGYVLLGSILFVFVRGLLVHQPTIELVKSIGALSSMLVPQGLVVTITLLFTYGAAYLSRKRVLLQEVNSTEKLGRIKNLCMDKTGTLTENSLTVEDIHVPDGTSREKAMELTRTYIESSNDVSQTMSAIKNFLGQGSTHEMVDVLSFSSNRKYGAVGIKLEQEDMIIFAGAPDIFLPAIELPEEKAWVEKMLSLDAHQGKRILSIVRAQGSAVAKELSNQKLSVIALFVLNNELREGISDAINYFQNRDISVRIISGDNIETVKAVAMRAGVLHTHAAITGPEMEAWTPADYESETHKYFIFARIKPEQKERIIEVMKRDGFTAMVGDGANDALAIKKADLGIAMFDGAAATRQIASIVLMNNSFADLPQAVKLADSIIKNIEIFASVFLSQTLVGFFFFILLSLLGYSFPITPFNITFINYFVIGLPGSLVFYWAIRPHPQEKVARPQQFLKRVLPFAITSAIVQSLAIMTVFLFKVLFLHDTTSTTLVVLTIIGAGFTFFINTQKVYGGITTSLHKIQFLCLGILELVILYVAFKIPFAVTFFNIPLPTFSSLLMIMPILALVVIIQFYIAKRFKEEL